ncbi:MAG TPA: POTRA domain-containing protein [Edaphobacter sp.]|nr:POTRA domain-containing protein [Edaphobacter sp.]
MVVESNSLPDEDRKQIIRLFQQKTYLQPEIGVRIETALKNLGYFKAVVNEPTVSFITQQAGRKIADVTVKVNQGAQYRLREIQIQNATVFPSIQLQKLFHLQRGEFANITKLREGLENLRNLYATRGYVNFVAVPEAVVNESRRTIDLVVSVDEGKPFNFGQLYLEGVEPYAGAGKTLKDSWKLLEGKRYNSLELRRWFLANRSTWHAGPQFSQSISTSQDSKSNAVNITLSQWLPCKVAEQAEYRRNPPLHRGSISQLVEVGSIHPITNLHLKILY